MPEPAKVEIELSPPYPPLLMDEKQWMDNVALVSVKLDSVIYTKATCDFRELLREYEGLDRWPHLVAYEARLYVERGHCRIARALFGGYDYAKCRVLYYEAYERERQEALEAEAESATP